MHALLATGIHSLPDKITAASQHGSSLHVIMQASACKTCKDSDALLSSCENVLIARICNVALLLCCKAFIFDAACRAKLFKFTGALTAACYLLNLLALPLQLTQAGD